MLLNSSTVKPGIVRKKKLAIEVNSPLGVCHKKYPNKYPPIAPNIEPIVQIAANLNDFFEAPKHNAISKTSGGIGKKLDSAKANMKSAGTPHLVSAQCNIQLYSCLNQFI